MINDSRGIEKSYSRMVLAEKIERVTLKDVRDELRANGFTRGMGIHNAARAVVRRGNSLIMTRSLARRERSSAKMSQIRAIINDRMKVFLERIGASKTRLESVSVQEGVVTGPRIVRWLSEISVALAALFTDASSFDRVNPGDIDSRMRK